MPRRIFTLVLILAAASAGGFLLFSNQLQVKNVSGASLVSGQAQSEVFGEPVALDPQASTPAPPAENQQKNTLPVLAAAPASVSDLVPSQPGIQDQIDDILEKIDGLKRQIADLEVRGQKTSPALVVPTILTDDHWQIDPNNKPITAPPKTTAGGGGGGGGGNIFYQKLLISEVQIAGEAGLKEEFVELYNPTSQDVDLNNWYVQRKTKTGSSYSSFAPSALFSGKKISANGYFLIAREGSSFAGNIFTDNPLTEGNVLVIKNPKGEISDMVGFGGSQEYEASPAPSPEAGRSIGRLPEEGDTGDNSVDFEINTPTPGALNVIYAAPAEPAPQNPVPETPAETVANILINEVQISGATTKDEFIELYNPNNVDIPLAGFSLKKKTAAGNESNLVSAGSFLGTIKALGYFLIAPQDNDDGIKNYTGLTAPDLRYSGKTFSIAANNTVLLYDASGALLDKVGFGSASDFETAAAPNPAASQSIERVGSGGDANDNSLDFTISDTPSPKGAFDAPAQEVVA